VSAEQERQRTVLYEAMNAEPPTDLEGAVLTAWVAVCEWVDEDGTKWLSRLSGTPGGDFPTAWTEEGMLRHAIGMRNDAPVDDE
jgi:hypothetical protein